MAKLKRKTERQIGCVILIIVVVLGCMCWYSQWQFSSCMDQAHDMLYCFSNIQ